LLHLLVFGVNRDWVEPWLQLCLLYVLQLCFLYVQDLWCPVLFHSNLFRPGFDLVFLTAVLTHLALGH